MRALPEVCWRMIWREPRSWSTASRLFEGDEEEFAGAVAPLGEEVGGG